MTIINMRLRAFPGHLTFSSMHTRLQLGPIQRLVSLNYLKSTDYPLMMTRRIYSLANVPRPRRKRALQYLGTKVKTSMGTIRNVSGNTRWIRSLQTKSDSSGTVKDPNKLSSYWQWVVVPVITILLITAYTKRRRPKTDEDPVISANEKPLKLAKPWQVAAYSTIPLKAISRLWGQFNDVTLPVWMREPGYKFYSFLFGVNLNEIGEKDLKKYKNLGQFFYRELQPGARPIDPNACLVSPADGKVLHIGVIEDNQVEQVKGVTYSLDALLGKGYAKTAPSHDISFDDLDENLEIYDRDKDFAVMNGIPYTLDDLIGDDDNRGPVQTRGDKAVTPNASSTDVATVAKDLMIPEFTAAADKELFFAVIYLAPGDYHRFHSPTNWVSDIRRHFVGELYSVAPYFQKRLRGLFCLNERVALLGKWKHGFFSMTPVGATNVGSIRINFDKDLRTNTKYLEPVVNDDDAQEKSSPYGSVHRPKNGTCYEATYSKASKLLGGYPLVKGEMMGGFMLGSTVVLVFEAPKSFKFNVKAGQVIKVGEALGDVPRGD